MNAQGQASPGGYESKIMRYSKYTRMDAEWTMTRSSGKHSQKIGS